MPDTARVFITGDASSIKKAMEEAGLYAEAASAKIAKASKTTESGFLGMSGAGKKAASEIEHTTGRIGSAIANIATSGNLAIAGIVGVGVAVEGIKKSADTFEEIGKTVLKVHELTGLSVKSASQYAAVAKVNDINVKGLLMSFTTLSKNVQAVTNANDGLTKSAHTQENAFKTLGLPLKDVLAAHGNLNRLLPQVITAFEHLPGSVNKAATAQALFGRGAKELVPLMHTGALGLKEQLEEAEKYGAAVGKMSSNEFKQFLKSQDEAKFALLGLQMTIGRDVAPALSELIAGFAHAAAEIRNGSGKIGKAAKSIGDAFQVAAAIIRPVVEQIVGIVAGMVKSISGLVHAVKGILTGNFTEAWDGVKQIFAGAVDALKAFFNPIYDVGKYLIGGLVKGIESGAEAVMGAFESIGEGAIDVGKKILSIKSPSMEFHKIGRAVSEGFAQGISAGAPSAHGAVKNLMASTAAAAGGFTQAAGTNYRVGNEPTIAADLGRLGRALGVKLTGISGYRTPQHSVEVGGFANDPHTRGEASDTEGAQSIPEATLEKFGLTRPFPGAKEANHIQLLARAVSGRAVSGRAGSGPSGDLDRASLEALWIKAGGPPSKARLAASIALAESAGQVGNVGDQGTSFGLWQIHTPAHPQYSSSKLSTDPLYNAKAAVDISGGGSTFAPWTTFKTGAYQQFLSGPGGALQTLGGATHPAPWMPGAHERATLAAANLTAIRAHRQVAAFETGETAGEELQSLHQSRWTATPPDLASPAGQATATARAEKTLSTDRAKKRMYAKELVALRHEAAGFQKAAGAYRKAARHLHDPKQKKEVLDKAAAYAAKLEQAQAAANALGGKIYAAETSIIEAETTLANVPGEGEQAQAAAAQEVQAANLNTYQSALGKVDAEVRAGLKTEGQGKEAKTQIASSALSGGYGALSEEGRLSVMGDLREFSAALQEGTEAVKSHTAALEEATKALTEFTSISNNIAQVEVGSLSQSLAETVNGGIGGIMQARRLTAGSGSAAHY